MKQGKGTLTISQAAEYLNVHEDTLKRWERDGRLPFIVGRTKGGHRRYLTSQLDELKELLRSGSLPERYRVPGLQYEGAVIESCKDWKSALLYADMYVDAYVSDKPLLVARHPGPIKETKQFIAVLVYAAAVMDEPRKRIDKWVYSMGGWSRVEYQMMSEVSAILHWQQNREALKILENYVQYASQKTKDIVHGIITLVMREEELLTA
jgi:excisionase family DNA binding protein